MQVWAEPFTKLRVPKIFNLRLDPYERASDTSNTYFDWLLDHAFTLVPAQAYVAEVHGDLQGLPAAPEGRDLHGREGQRDDETAKRRLTFGGRAGRRKTPCGSVIVVANEPRIFYLARPLSTAIASPAIATATPANSPPRKGS